MRRWWRALLVALGVWAVPAAAAEGLVFGVYVNRSNAEAVARWSPLATQLEAALGTPVRLLPLTQGEMETAVRRNQVDVLLTNPAHYVRLRQSYPMTGVLATLVEEEGGVLTSAFGGVIFTRTDQTAFNTLRDLRRARIAAQDLQHLAGALAQLHLLKESGVAEVGELDLRFRPFHDDVVRAVLADEADAGFVRTGILEAMVAQGQLRWEEIRVMNRQTLPGYPFVVSTRLFPEWAVIALPHLDPALVARTAAALLSLGAESAAARQAGIGGFTVAADYLPVEAVMRELRVPPFDLAPPFTLADIWQRHAVLIVMFSVAAALAIIALVALGLGRRHLLASQAALRASEERLDMVLKGTDVGAWSWDVQTGEAHFNARWAEMLGLQLEAIAPMHIDVWFSRVHPDDLELSEARLLAHLRGDAPQYLCEFRMRHRDGHWLWMEARGKVYAWSEDRQPLQMAGTHADITERKGIEDRLRLSASFLAAAQEGIMVTDADNRIVDVNHAFTTITGYTREEALGRSPTMLSSGRHGSEFYREMWRQLARDGNWRGEIWNRRKDGDVFPEQLSITAVRDGDGHLTHYVAVLSDISYLKEHEQELRRMAHFDSLTGLPNRRLLADRLRQALAHTIRRGGMMAVVVLDLDGFKPVNDAFGHEAGDQVLRQVGQRLKAALRGGDTAARLGGDEFVLVLLELVSREECEQALMRILAALAVDMTVERHGVVSVSASMGATLFPSDDADADTLLRHADQAMYIAKQEGRSRVHIFDALRDREVKVMREGLMQLTRALEQGEFVLHYQPQVDMRMGTVLGVEALLRWQHPQRGLLYPAEFLPMVDGTEQEIALGRWVIEAALAQLRVWRARGMPLRVSVNLSPRHFMQPGFVAELDTLLGRHAEIDAHDLELELVESADVGDWAQAAQVLAECRELGVSFALDDFGTGYSSLVQLRRLNAQTLKIDQHFVRDMLEDSDDLIIVESVIRLSESFRLSVIAEGVESEDQAAALIALGCARGQGYGIARPMPPEAVPEWCARWQQEGFWRRIAGDAGL